MEVVQIHLPQIMVSLSNAFSFILLLASDKKKQYFMHLAASKGELIVVDKQPLEILRSPD